MRLEIRKPTGPVEDSVALRLVVAAAVEIAILAVVAQPEAVEPVTAVAALTLAPLGYLFSYRRRHHPNVALKVALSVALLAALGQFLGSVRAVTSVDQARIPLATLFLWVQVLHAFDVPRRRDLAFSMASSLILMAEAGSLSLSTSFLVFLVPWVGLAGSWLALSARPRPDELTVPASVRRIAPEGRPRRAGAFRSALISTVVAVLAASLAFLAMPRLPGGLVRTPPFSLTGRPSALPAFDGGVQNPGLPADPGSGTVDFGSGGYPGFSDVVDLRARGRLSDELAFRVRAQQAALWRAEVFDAYDGSTWTISDDATADLGSATEDGSYQIPFAVMRRNLTQGIDLVRMTQTFTIESPQPNVLFGASSLTNVYFPSAGLRVDAAGSVRAPILLDEGLVYSVVSEMPVLSGPYLRRADGPVPDRLAPYLELPAGFPTRVGELTRRITANATTPYDRVEAVQAWLRANTRYDLDVPRDPDGVDPVDHFLFETRRGYCEQIASSMALMLRTVGIPTRLVTGYGPGERNPLTGYFEVKGSDAHAWLEVWYPSIGWVQYDPTFGVPQANPGLGSRFMAGPAFAALGRIVSRIVPEPVKHALAAAARGVAGIVRTTADRWPLIAFAIGFAAATVWAWRRRRRSRMSAPLTPGEAAFAELIEALSPAGHEHVPHQTPSEFLRRVEADDALETAVLEAADLVVRTFERERFAPAAAKPSTEELIRARAAAGTVRQLVRSN